MSSSAWWFAVVLETLSGSFLAKGWVDKQRTWGTTYEQKRLMIGNGSASIRTAISHLRCQIVFSFSRPLFSDFD